MVFRISRVAVAAVMAALLVPAMLPSLSAGDGPPVVVEAGPLAEGRQRTIGAIRIERGVDEKVGYFFSLNEFYVPECFPMEGADRRLICDFLETRLAPGVELDLTPIRKPSVRMRVVIHHEPVEKVRIVFDLDQSGDYDIEQLFIERDSEFVLIIHGSALDP